ncbi:TonB-dependent receptor domain-containing protein [Brevundimonas vesicularis]|uniref:TonB-dependent receptor n=1 Tax=Brevundimonas vesicularis TaxID=41276 RepID=A0ABU4KLH1_BREVE|nr:TonB-dependent receptor [Brevundimonas vesicularis]MDX2333570.1 TonB-dependent receptor [Brevundimonas vesicularis]
MKANRNVRRSAALVFLMASSGMATVIAAGQAQAQTQTQSMATYAIPAQPLGGALAAFSRTTGISVVYGDLIPDVRSAGVSGRMTAAEALSRLLAGGGLSFRFISADTVRLERAASATPDALQSGAIQLGAVRVEGASGAQGAISGDGLSDDAVSTTAAAVEHIGADRIDRYRGSSPADIFRGTPGVMSGEARNGAGAIDLNIRGLQGFGRVTTTIDGAENAVTIYQGYQGVSNRTFVDPDLIASVDIAKGANAASFGNAGSVAIRTVDAADIVKDGETWALRMRGGLRTNTSDPMAGAVSGYRYISGRGVAEPSPTGMDRPDALEPTDGWGSLVGAFRGDALDVLAGYTWRQQGNYHAGAHGPTADPVNIGDTRAPWGGAQSNTMINAGLLNFRSGEEVLNTQLETQSWLAKATARFGDGQSLQMGYTGFRSEAGDRIASRLTSRTGQATQQAQTAGTALDTYTARYRWTPSDSDRIDLKANLYWSHLELRNPVRGGRLLTAADLGLDPNFRIGSDSDLWGAEISNQTRLFPPQGDLRLNYGLSYRAEDTRGSRHADILEGWNTPRNGARQEIAGFLKSDFSPRDWLTVEGGLRYTHFWSEDRVDPYERAQVQGNRVRLGFKKDEGGVSPSLGLIMTPLDGLQAYVRYSSTLRAPALTETVSAFNSFVANTGIRPERSRNWDLGASYSRDSLLARGDRGQVKFGYFNWAVDDYIARNVRPDTLSLNIENIDSARFEGLELSGRYQSGGFTADLATNYYLKVEYCRTADTCGAKSLYGDYATNHVPPEYVIDLSVSQALLRNRLTLGGRVQHTGPRAIGHGDVTAQGAGQFIALIDWEPYTLTDLFADYRLTQDLTFSARVENLFDRFYADPLSLVAQPGPGRTFTFSLTRRFGGAQPLGRLSEDWGRGEITRDWTGFHLGALTGGQGVSIKGETTNIDGPVNPAAARESADAHAQSGLFGLEVGYNRQLANRWVVGLELEAARTWLHAGRKLLSVDPGLAAQGWREAATDYTVDWTAGVNARLGYAFGDRFMLFGLGGLALAREVEGRDQYRSTSADQQNPLGRETGVAFVERVDHVRKGFTVGFGGDYALSDRWSLRADYRYTHFGAEEFRFEKATRGTGLNYTVTTAIQVGTEVLPPFLDPGDPLCAEYPAYCETSEYPIYRYENTNYTGTSTIAEGRRASNEMDVHAFRLGLSYRF